MYLISIGGMRMKGWRVFPRVVLGTYRALKAARAAEGCAHADIFRKGRTYFALSVWTDLAAMRAFAHGGVHGALMPMARRDMSYFRNESYESAAIPTRRAAREEWERRA